MTPIQFIHQVRGLYPVRYPEHSGGCLKFHLLLKDIFPDAVGYYNSDHVITEINGKFYDIDGEVSGTQTKGFLLLSEYGYRFIRKAYREYLNEESLDALKRHYAAQEH